MTDHDDFEPPHAASPTDHVLSELELFGHRPFDDEPDPRPWRETIPHVLPDRLGPFYGAGRVLIRFRAFDRL